MKDIIEVDCYLQVGEDGKFIILPRTSLDKSSINSFLDSRGRYVSLRLMQKEAFKSYDQTKAFWALASLHYRVFNGGTAPTSKELKYWYEDLLKPELFPVRVNSVRENKFEPKNWSELTKKEGMEVIEKMLSLVSEATNAPDDIAASCKDFFEWLNNEKKKDRKESTFEDSLKELENVQKDFDIF